MTIPRFVLIAGLLFIIPAGLSGCGQGDGGEFHAYNPPAGVAADPGVPVGSLPGSNTATDTPAVEPEPETGTRSIEGSDPSQGRESATAGAETSTATSAEAVPVESTTSTDVAPNAVAAVTPGNVVGGLNTGLIAPAPLPGGVQLLVPEKDFQTVGPDGSLRVTYNDLDLLKVLNMDPVTVDAPEQFPQWLSDLEGKRIRLRGYMRPDLVAEGLTGFILARDTQACCFGPNTKAYDIIPTKLRDGMTTDYIELKPFDVVGVFHIEVNETRSRTGERKVEFLYNIDDAVIIRL